MYTREPYAMATRKGDKTLMEAVNSGLRGLLESGRYFELYEKWFGSGRDAPYPMTPETKEYLMAQLKK